MGDIITLTSESPAIQYLCRKDKHLAKVISMIGNISYQTHDDPYDFLVHEVIEQMLSVKAGKQIYSRLERMCGGKITPESINQFSTDELRTIGTSNAKANYIKGITDAVISGKINFTNLEAMSDSEVIRILTQLKGIGNWTAHMYLIFVLDRQDILPTSDAAFLQVYEWLYKTNDRSKKAVEKKCKKWRPYSSIAARYFYRILDGGYTKETFHLYK